MFKLILQIIFFLVAGISLQGQADSSTTTRSRSSIFIEVGGNGVEFGNGLILANDAWTRPLNHFSINYDRIFHVGNKVIYSLRVGTNIPASQNPHIIPLMVNFVFGAKEFHFELSSGVAVAFYNAKYRSPIIAFCSFIGVRYQRNLGGFMAKAGITPTIGIHQNDIYSSPLIGISLGYSF
jgi:hypothetical protein